MINTFSKWTTEDIIWLKNNYYQKGLMLCCQHLKTKTKTQIQGKCRKLKLTIAKRLRSNITSIGHKKRKLTHSFSVSPDQFFNIQSPQIAYILGLLWADGTIYNKGYMNTISLECQLEDFKQFLPIFLSTGIWKCYYRTRKNRKPQGTVKINNKPLVNFLIDNDYKAKSYESACKIISKIPHKLKYYWFRGFLDGDGCISFDGRIEFSSAIQQNWTFLTNLLDNMNLYYTLRKHIHKKNGKIHSSSSIRLNKKSSIIFGIYIYKNFNIDKIGLKRKHERFIKHL